MLAIIEARTIAQLLVPYLPDAMGMGYQFTAGIDEGEVRLTIGVLES